MQKNVKVFFSIGTICILLAGIGFVSSSETAAQTSDLTLFLPAEPYNYSNPNLPAYFNEDRVRNADNTPQNNPVTDAGATLGRVLFYDVNLSANNTISCGSCHIQADGFSDSAQFSLGFEGGLTGRNSMGLANARYYRNGHFFWDERADTLEDQVLMPIQDSVEMGLTLNQLVSKVSSQAYYPELFNDAFGSPTVTSDRISLALAQFVRAMVSYQSKYDEGLQTNFENYTREENRGRRIFFDRNEGNCVACHGTEAIVSNQARNNGLDATTIDDGAGGAEFKSPSLRNIALTAPYMHDGRFQTLAEVVEFYNSGVQPHPNLDPQLENGNGQPRRLNLSEQEKSDLIAFLNTLTDNAFITDTKFSNPFLEVNSQIFLPAIQN